MTSARRPPWVLATAGLASVGVALVGVAAADAITHRGPSGALVIPPQAAAATASAMRSPADARREPSDTAHSLAPSTPPGGVAAISGLHPAPLPRTSAALPARLVVPRLGLDTALIRLGLDRSGALSVPASPYDVGWYSGGPAPGEVGPAVLAGHVDSKRGPGVFFRLREMRAGDAVVVRTAGRQSVRFVVTAVSQYAKAAFPTSTVYGPTPFPELRLVTCGGTFDWAKHHYRDNIVVYARRTAA